jgi:colanic acid/amylovoran biosynthesis glycosyltransferase
MKIASFHTTYLGFTETFVYEQLRRLRGFEAHAVALAAENLARFPFPRLYTRPRRGALSLVPRALERYVAPWALSALCRISPRLIHAHFGTSGVYALPYARLLRRPLVVSYYGFDVAYAERRERHPELAGYFAELPALFRRAALHLALTEEMRRRLIALGCPAGRVLVHPNGVDTARFRPSPRPPGAGMRVLMCGREVEKKGFEYGLRALAAASREAPGITLELLGAGGPLRPPLEALARELGLSERATFLSYEESTARALSRCDLILVPSVTAADGDAEGLPTVLLEAFAAGVPAVASRHAGIPAVVREGETGLLCGERDVAGLTRALVEMAGAPERRAAMGEKARRLVERGYDIDLLVSRLEEHYRDVLREGARP